MVEENKIRVSEISSHLQKGKIRFECRYYTGYKPCGISEFCDGCGGFEPCGMRILIIKLAALGDVLLTTPILPALKGHYLQSHIVWLTDPDAIPLLQNNSYIDALYGFDTGGALCVTSIPFDVAINFEKEERALALFDAIRAKEKRGFAYSAAGTLSIANDASLYALQMGLHDELKFRLNKETYQETTFKMAEIPYHREEYVFHLSGRAEDFACDTAKKLNLSSGRFHVGLNTGCGTVFETKQWTVNGFCDLASALAHDGDCDLLLLGGSRECEFNQAVLKKCGTILKDTGCNNSLEEFAGIISLCDVVVSSDSLAAHLAIALKKHVAIFFGPTCSQEVDLYGRGVKIETDFPCAPCYLKTCSRLPNCMENMDAKRIYDAVRSCLNDIKLSRM